MREAKSYMLDCDSSKEQVEVPGARDPRDLFDYGQGFFSGRLKLILDHPHQETSFLSDSFSHSTTMLKPTQQVASEISTTSTSKVEQQKEDTAFLSSYATSCAMRRD